MKLFRQKTGMRKSEIFSSHTQMTIKTRMRYIILLDQYLTAWAYALQNGFVSLLACTLDTSCSTLTLLTEP
jgi:hypothetical protein